MDKKLIIIPTYNEIENIEAITRKVFSLEGNYHILVIDDGSPDGTAAAVKKLQEEFPDRLFLVERSGKLGLGTAYLTGFKWSLGHGYDYTFLPQSRRPPPPVPGLQGRGGPCRGQPLLQRNKRGGLATWAYNDVIFRIPVRQDRSQDESI